MILVNSLNDNQIEVRERATDALSTLLQAKFFETTPELVTKFSTAAHSKDQIQGHAGVLGLSAIVLAFPYSVPEFLPGVLMTICRFATDKSATIRVNSIVFKISSNRFFSGSCKTYSFGVQTYSSRFVA